MLPLLRDLSVLFLDVYQCFSFVDYMYIVHVHRVFAGPHSVSLSLLLVDGRGCVSEHELCYENQRQLHRSDLINVHSIFELSPHLLL